jgi:hypothetical protein
MILLPSGKLRRWVAPRSPPIDLFFNTKVRLTGPGRAQKQEFPRRLPTNRGQGTRSHSMEAQGHYGRIRRRGNERYQSSGYVDQGGDQSRQSGEFLRSLFCKVCF